MNVVCQAAQPIRVDLAQNAHALKNLNRIDSTHDIYLTPIHFRALNDVVNMTNLRFWHPMGTVRVPTRIFFQTD